MRRARRALTPYILVLPASVLLLVFVYGVVNGILQGFGIMPFIGLTELTLEYYEEALTNANLSVSITYSLYLAAVSAIVATVLGTIVCAVFVRLKMGGVRRIVGIQLPIMTSHSIVVLFMLALLGSSGLVARCLYALGLIDAMQDMPTMLGAVSGWGIILVYIWKEAPYVAFCTLTIMGNISSRYGEAAACLGAGPLRSFLCVTLPLCKGAIARAFLVIFAFVFGSYEVPYLLGASKPKALPLLAYLEYVKPDILDRASAMALNGIMAGITIALAIVYFALVVRDAKREEGLR